MWDDCPTRAVRKMFMCFLFIGFLCPQLESGFSQLLTKHVLITTVNKMALQNRNVGCCFAPPSGRNLQGHFSQSQSILVDFFPWLTCYGMGNGPRTKNGREMAGGHFGGGSQNVREMAGRAGRKSPNSSCPALCLTIFRPFRITPKKMAAGHFSAILASGPVSHSVAGQPSRKFLGRFWSKMMGLVGVWNVRGYGIAFFRALILQISEPEIWQNRSSF